METENPERISERELQLQKRIDDLARQLSEARRTRGTPVQTIVEEDENLDQEGARLTKLQHELALAREQISKMRDNNDGDLKSLKDELAQCKEQLNKAKIDENVSYKTFCIVVKQ